MDLTFLPLRHRMRDGQREGWRERKSEWVSEYANAYHTEFMGYLRPLHPKYKWRFYPNRWIFWSWEREKWGTKTNSGLHLVCRIFYNYWSARQIYRQMTIFFKFIWNRAWISCWTIFQFIPILFRIFFWILKLEFSEWIFIKIHQFTLALRKIHNLARTATF